MKSHRLFRRRGGTQQPSAGWFGVEIYARISLASNSLDESNNPKMSLPCAQQTIYSFICSSPYFPLLKRPEDWYEPERQHCEQNVQWDAHPDKVLEAVAAVTIGRNPREATVTTAINVKDSDNEFAGALFRVGRSSDDQKAT
jgi:hypothetical protein